MAFKYMDQYRKAAPIYGAYIGCMWIAAFICMANTIVLPALSLAGLGIGIGSVLAIVVFAYQFFWKICQGDLSFSRSWLLVLQIIVYASILMAFGIFIYMKFLDSGNFSAYYEQMLQDPATRQLMDQMLANSGVTSEEFVDQFISISPIDLALSMMESCIILGFIGSIPLALLSRIKFGSKTENNK